MLLLHQCWTHHPACQQYRGLQRRRQHRQHQWCHFMLLTAQLTPPCQLLAPSTLLTLFFSAVIIFHFVSSQHGIIIAIVTHTRGSRAMGRVISGICDFVCLSVCVCVHSKRKMAWANNTKLGTYMYSVSVAWHALTWSSKGQRSRSCSYKTITLAWLLCATAVGVGLHILWLLRFLVHLICFFMLTQLQVAASSWTKPTRLGCSLPVDCCCPHLSLPFIIITESKN